MFGIVGISTNRRYMVPLLLLSPLDTNTDPANTRYGTMKPLPCKDLLWIYQISEDGTWIFITDMIIRMVRLIVHQLFLGPFFTKLSKNDSLNIEFLCHCIQKHVANIPYLTAAALYKSNFVYSN